MTKHDPDAGFEPAFAAPPNACDTHFHVFGAAERYSYGTDIRYKPLYEPLEAYLKVARRLGLVRYVFVQPSAYGFDNSCILDSMRELNPAVRRGIIDLDESKTSDKELSNLNAVGVRGTRVNISPIRKPEAGLAASMLPRIARLTKICKELGWHLDFLTPGWLVSELMPTLRELPIEFSVAHMGLYLAKNGPDQPGFQEFLKPVGDGSKPLGQTHRHLSVFHQAGLRRCETDRASAEANVPDQLIWGSDFLICRSTTALTDELNSTICSVNGRPMQGCANAVLADNPAQLLGFK